MKDFEHYMNESCGKSHSKKEKKNLQQKKDTKKKKNVINEQSYNMIRSTTYRHFTEIFKELHIRIPNAKIVRLSDHVTEIINDILSDVSRERFKKFGKM